MVDTSPKPTTTTAAQPPAATAADTKQYAEGDDSAAAQAMKEERNEVRFLIESTQSGGIIGKEGANVKHVRESSGAIVTIQKPMGAGDFGGGERRGSQISKVQAGAIPDRVLVIKGDNDQIVDAAEQVAQLIINNDNLQIQQRQAKQQQREPKDAKPAATDSSATAAPVDTITMKLLIHKNLVGAIIGKSGSTVQSISSESGMRVQVSNHPLPNSTDKIVSLHGKVTGVKRALTAILKLLDENPLKPSTRSFPYQPSIGTSGAAAVAAFAGAQMQGPYGQSQFPPQQPPAAGFPVYQQLAYPFPAQGSQPAAGQAQPTSTQKIAIPASSAGALIGRRGSTAKTLRLQTGCSISIADADSSNPSERIVTLTGTNASIHSAILAIRHLVEQSAAQDSGEQPRPASTNRRSNNSSNTKQPPSAGGNAPAATAEA